MFEPSRRHFTIGAALLPLAGRAQAARADTLDLASPSGTLAAWMKLHTSLDDGDLYYWYRARMDVAQPDQPIRMFIGYETLYRFQVRQVGPESYEVTRWETSVFTDPDTNEPVDEMVNPLNGRTIQPFHFKEGPVTFAYTTQRPRIVGSPVIGTGDTPFQLDWAVVGDDIWASRELFVSFPHPLKPSDWPLESHGEMLHFSNISTVRGSFSEVQDREVRSARCQYSYQATARWMPWMLMGAEPGHMIWRAQGAKFTDPADLPSSARALFEERHPEVFQSKPWDGHRSMYGDFAKLRSPAS